MSARISEGGSTYTGELPAEAMDLAGDRFIRPGGPIAYELTATIVSDQIIVTGWVETTLELLCVACAEFFSTSIRISSFLHAYPLQAGQETLDLTADIREDILLIDKKSLFRRHGHTPACLCVSARRQAGTGLK